MWVHDNPKKEKKERKHEKYQSLSMKGLYLFHCQTEMERHKIKDRERDSLKKTLKRDWKYFWKNRMVDKTRQDGQTDRQTFGNQPCIVEERQT